MARLTRDQAEKILEAPKNKELIQRAIGHEERLIFHNEPLDATGLESNEAYNVFTAWVAKLLPADKFQRFLQLMTLPIETVDSTESIYEELAKVFDAQDRYIKYNFRSSEFEQDFNDYLTQIGNDDFWRNQGFETMKKHINSFIVCDMPSVKSSMRPEPYFYILDIRKVIDVDINSNKHKVEYIAFQETTEKKVVIDDEFYRIYERSNPNEKFMLTEEVKHSFYAASGKLIAGVGYCPVKSFWDKYIYGTKGTNKRGPITDVLGKLDWLLFFRISKKYQESYAWPVIVTYEQECSYQDEQGHVCQDGYITYQTTPRIEGEAAAVIRKKCPECEARNLIGPGSEFTIKAPRDKEQHDMMVDPLKSIDVVSAEKLKITTEEINRLEDEIYLNCVGYDGDSLNNEAINETQVAANFESKESVIFRIKSEFEKNICFATETIARMRYGNAFINADINLGEEFYLTSVEDLVKLYKDTEKTGLPVYFSDKLSEQIRRTKFKTNSEQIQRDEILSHLEPYPGVTLAEMKNLGLDMSDPDNFILKLNFITFIRQFERENMNIVEFGSLIQFNRKIDIIKQKLLSYVAEQRSRQQVATPPGSRNDGGTTGRTTPE